MLIDNVEDTPSELDVEEMSNQTQQEQVQAPEPVAEDIPDKYKGKSVADIVKMHQEAEKLIGKQAQEVGEVRKLADELIKQNISSSKTVTQTEVEPEIDFFEDPQKAIRNTVDKHPDVLAAREATRELKKMQIQSQLAQNHPDFVSVVNDPKFVDWVKASKVRMGLYAKADGELDYDSADELLSTFKQLQAVQVQQSSSQDKQTRSQNLKAVSVDTGGTGESSKKVYRRTDLIRLKMTDPSRYEALQPEIMAAYAEGRVK